MNMDSEQNNSLIEPNPYEVPYSFQPPPPKEVNTVNLWVCIVTNILFLTGGFFLGYIVRGNTNVSIQSNSGHRIMSSVATTAIVQLPDAKTVIQEINLPEYFNLTGVQSQDLSSFSYRIHPESYAIFTICEGAGGSGCSPTNYALAIYSHITDANNAVNAMEQANSQWSWIASSGQCVLMSDDTVHSGFLAMQNSVGGVYPCTAY
ncbi:MAG TPA: hypothetical protein VFV38_48815 [Ktedonobacteraceae bacterium]|nr:hypothetical protein [Ktedonobacteraceae bacterium]